MTTSEAERTTVLARAPRRVEGGSPERRTPTCSAADLYDRALLSRCAAQPAARPSRAGRVWWVRDDRGRVIPLDPALDRWVGPVEEGDRSVVRRCSGPTLDVGCGPGRLVGALGAAGVGALGVDVSTVAVAMTRARGGAALRADVFRPLPAEGGWDGVLLLDGNIGIGGDPVRLLRRCRDLMAPGGAAVVECAPPGRRGGPTRLRLESGDEVGTWFPWAVLPVDQAAACASAAALGLRSVWSEGSRWFAALGR